MRRVLAVLVALAVVMGSGGLALAVEQLDLSAPLVVPDVTSWKVDEVHMWRTVGRLLVVFVGPDGEVKVCQDSGASATTTMNALNKANLTTNSLQKRAITWAQGLTPACLGAGAVSGSPD